MVRGLLLGWWGLWLWLPLAALAMPKPSPQIETAGGRATAVFAGGCFWCMEQPFDQLPGVLATTAGYIGGTLEQPTYAQVSAGRTGHFEALQVSFDPTRVTYQTLLATFWRNIDPLDGDGQFCDRGPQYKSAIFVADASQAGLAETSLAQVRVALDAPVATAILPATEFFAAEDYHQNYYQKNPLRYKYYRWACERDERLSELWGREQ